MRRRSPHPPAIAPLLVLIQVFGLLLAMALPAAAESLWKAETPADGTLYSDQVARRRGDLITILVKETTEVTDKNKTKLDRKQTITNQVNAVPFTNELPASVGSSGKDKLPLLDLSGQDKFDGEGNYEHSGEVLATVTGRVLEVLDNGNLLVEGRREIKVNDDTKVIRITGMIRTADIRSDNTVLSEKLHDFQVAIEGEGPLTVANQQGWAARLWGVVRPW